jgi:DNA-binding transcriptional ArsR family regulator
MQLELEPRVAHLEARVARLEEASTGPPPAADPRSEATFWALEGLKARMPDPGGVLFTGAVTLEDGRRAEWQEAFATLALLDGFGDQAAALSALAHPVRLLILRELLRGERSAAELSAHERLGTSGQTYHHMRQLVAAGWLRSTGRGRYAVPTERVIPLLATIAAVTR